MSEENINEKPFEPEDEEEYFGMRYDIVFKKAFVDNNDLLKGFISDMLDIPLEDMGEVTVSNPELIPDGVDDKFSRLDIKANIRNAVVNIEMTISQTKDYEKRTMYYWAGIYHNQKIKGYSYSSLKKTISINVLAYKAYSHKDYHSVYVLYDKNHDRKIEDVLEIHFFELPKIMSDPLTEQEKKQTMWLETISADSKSEMRAVCDKYRNEYVTKCARVVTEMNADGEFKQALQARHEAEIERGAMLYDARQDGIAEGLIKGELNGRTADLVRIMKKMKYSLTASMDFLDIPQSEYDAYTEIIRRNYPDVTI